MHQTKAVCSGCAAGTRLKGQPQHHFVEYHGKSFMSSDVTLTTVSIDRLSITDGACGGREDNAAAGVR